MQAKVFGFVCVLAWFMAAPVAAQEGYPLIGTWSGEWGQSPKQRTQVLIVMEWDGEILSGIINPGFPDAAPIRVGKLDSTKWTVHLEAEFKDERGNPVRIVIDGKLENIGSYNRTLSGTWIQGEVKGDFKLTRE
ncbi:MAG: hypothetical protein HYU27_06695 [Acidobacteria bacterium]|nr:hypothetical protein [Acidobacteriota bacterium]